MITKNEALVNQFNSSNKELDQAKMITEAAKTTDALLQKAKDHNVRIDLTANNKADHYKGNDMKTEFKLYVDAVDNLKFQIERAGISTKDIPNIEKYGNAKVQSQNTEFDLNNIKPGQTPKSGRIDSGLNK